MVEAKTAIQIATISLALFNEQTQIQLLVSLLPFFYVLAVVVTLWSGMNYIASYRSKRA